MVSSGKSIKVSLQVKDCLFVLREMNESQGAKITVSVEILTAASPEAKKKATEKKLGTSEPQAL
jgi:hypothetical protein